MDLQFATPRPEDDRHADHGRPSERHRFLCLDLDLRDRQLLCIARRDGEGRRRLRRPALRLPWRPCRFRDEGRRTGSTFRLRLLQIRLVLPAVQLLHHPLRLDPDDVRHRARRYRRRAGGRTRHPHERHCRQQFQRGPQGNLPVDRLSRLVHQSLCLHADDGDRHRRADTTAIFSQARLAIMDSGPPSNLHLSAIRRDRPSSDGNDLSEGL